ncbi:MAG: methyltransferase type 11 [Lachnospiraceae bacterium]
MNNPWKEINLSDYENHMALDSVWQLQAMNQMMKEQLNQYDIQSVMILGIAGGNGLEHVDVEKITRVYGVDINTEYLMTTQKRYKNLSGILECLCVDLRCEAEKLPQVNMLIANLLIEYIGYECFQKVVKVIKSQYVSCIIQINTDDGFVSDSPYLHVFDELEHVHHQMAEQELKNSMEVIGYQLTQTLEYPLPNGKKLVQLDFCNNAITEG